MDTKEVEPQQSRTQADRNEHSRRVLLDATREIIATEGFRAVTGARLQAASGLSRGLVSYYFGSKEGLVLALIDKIEDGFKTQYHPVRESVDGFTGIASVFDVYLSRIGVDASTALAMVYIATDSASSGNVISDKMKAAYADLRELFVHLVHKGQEDGSIDPTISHGPISVVLESMLRGVVLQYLVDPDEIDLEAARIQIGASLPRMLRPQTYFHGSS